MCGIAGFAAPRAGFDAPRLEGIARGMARALAHRGPDDEGVWAEPGAGLAIGFRRLAIIDLSPAGAQPMLSASGRTAIAFNGEIYNAEMLRAAVAGRGLTWRGHSDTEALLEAIEAMGVEAALPRAWGMFAFAAWDRAQRRLHLARDRLGKKPLYVGRFGGDLVFGSELRALRAHPAFRAEIDPRALTAFMRFGYVPAPLSIFRGVEQLPPGGHGVLEPDGSWSVRRWWRVEEVAAAGRAQRIDDEEEALAGLDALLRDAVARRMVADVPLGAFLSGGIDSSLVVALMQRQAARPVRTFSIGFDIPGFDEAPQAAAVARALGTDHTEHYLREADALDLVPQLAETFDEPFADASQIPTILVSRLARRKVTVALTGDGGDEGFAGYTRYGLFGRLLHTTAPAPRLAGQAAHLAEALAASPLRAALPAGHRGEVQRWLARLALLRRGDARARLYSGIMQPGIGAERLLAAPQEMADNWWDADLSAAAATPTDYARLMDSLTYLPDDILVKVDRASMAAGLEARSPLLDHRVIAFAWRLSPSLLVRNGAGKWPLRRLLHRLIDPALVERPKMGFGAPVGAWLRGPLRGWAEDLLSPASLREVGLLDAAAVQRMLRRHMAGEAWHGPLWTTLMFVAWHRRWAGA